MALADVIVFGSAIMDFICYCPRLPKVGETIHGSKFCTGFGGKGANQCVAAARLGAKCAFIGNLGNDQWGQDYLDNMKSEGINTDFMQTVKGETTGIAAINVADSGDNQIVIVAGANRNLSVKRFKEALAQFSEAKILICQLETPVSETVQALKLFQGISILNAAPAIQNAPIELIRNASILCVNESEASIMAGTEVRSVEEAKDAIIRLVDMGAKTVILTMGEKGAVYSEPAARKVIHVPVGKVDKVVDTTGAGDAFIGALAFFLANYPKQSLTHSIGAACEIAAVSVQYPGTQSSFPRAEDIAKLRLMEKNFRSVEV